MYAWLMQEASAATGDRGIESAKIRFRSALLPAEQATISVTVDGDSVKLELSRDSEQLITGNATVAAPTE
jgi:hypothetical protein